MLQDIDYYYTVQSCINITFSASLSSYYYYYMKANKSQLKGNSPPRSLLRRKAFFATTAEDALEKREQQQQQLTSFNLPEGMFFFQYIKRCIFRSDQGRPSKKVFFVIFAT